MSDPNITLLLGRVAAGNQRALDELLPLVYAELRGIAERQLQREPPGHTLQATALVHEAYLRLIDQRNTSWTNRSHFYAIAARVVRRVLIDHARRNGRAKRGGGAHRVPLEALEADSQLSDVELLAMDDELERLAELDPTQARIIELRFFGGLSMPEVSHVLGMPLRSVEGNWAMARAWLKLRLRGEELS